MVELGSNPYETNPLINKARSPEAQLTQGLRQDLGNALGYFELIRSALPSEVLEPLTELFDLTEAAIQRASDRLNQFDAARKAQTNPNPPAV